MTLHHFYVLIAFLFFFACSGIKDEITVSKVIPPKNFIQDQKEKIKKTLTMGPSHAKNEMKINRDRKIIFSETKKINTVNQSKKTGEIYYSKSFIDSKSSPVNGKTLHPPIKPNQKLILLEKAKNWYHFLAFKTSPDAIRSGYINSIFGNVRSKPSMKSKIQKTKNANKPRKKEKKRG